MDCGERNLYDLQLKGRENLIDASDNLKMNNHHLVVLLNYNTLLNYIPAMMCLSN